MMNPWQGVRQPSIDRKVIRLANAKDRQKATECLIGALPYSGGKVMSVTEGRPPEAQYGYAVVAYLRHD